jgi:hypothetical protein
MKANESPPPRTIFIALLNGVEAKNILRSTVYENLRQDPFLRIVFLMRNRELAEVYRREFTHPNNYFEILPPLRDTFFERVFSRLKIYLLRSKTVDIHRRTHLSETGNHLTFLVSLAANRLLARPLFRSFIRALDYRFCRQPSYGVVFEKYRPTLVLLADLFNDLETAILREAKHRSVYAVGLVNTWDRVTSRWLIRLLPDDFIVFNKLVKAELAFYDDFPKARIYVSGTIQHDHLVTGRFKSREAFCRDYQIDPAGKILLYAPLGKFFDKDRPDLDKNLVRIIRAAADRGVFGWTPITLIVRFHPNDVVNLDEWPRQPNIIYQLPGQKLSAAPNDKVWSRTRGQNWDFSPVDLETLRDTLRASDVVICFYTSLSIDAAVLDRPVVNVDFDVKAGKIVPGHHVYYDSVHYSQAARTGAFRLVKNETEFFSAIKNYLACPALDQEKRKKLVTEQCYRLDGRSGERVAEFLLMKLQQTTKQQMVDR